jgi:DNA-directed RNA polymerase specialized sigma24 family protein
VSVPGSDAALINAIRSGDPGAYDVLRSRHGAAARRLASHLPRGQATVNDVVDWAFVQVLEAIRRGGGPTDAFRPYLLTAVQRAARDCAAGENSPIPTDDQDIPDPGQLMTGGPAGNGREETGTGGATGPAAVAAFMSLPERWRAVLWHTEIEDAAPAAVASLFGLGAAEAADLADRAREGMAQNAGIEPDDVHAVLRHAVAPAVLGAGAAGYLTELAYTAPASPARSSPRPGGPDHGPAGADLADPPSYRAGALMLGAPVAAAGRAGPGPATAGAGPPGPPGSSGAARTPVDPPPPKPGRPAGPAAEPEARPSGKNAAAGTTLLASMTAAAGAALNSTARTAAARWRGASPRQRNTVTGAAVLLVILAIVGYALTLSPDGGPATAARSRPAAPATPGPVSSSPAPVPSPTPTASTAPAAPAAPVAASTTGPPQAPPPASAVHLTAAVSMAEVVGFDRLAQVNFTVTNIGSATSAVLTARVLVPPGVSLTLGAGVPSGWTCGPADHGAICSHQSLAAGAGATDTLAVLLTSASACGQPIELTVTGQSAEASAATPVRCGHGRHGGHAGHRA